MKTKNIINEKINKVEIINKFFTNFQKENILLPVDQANNKFKNENCFIINCEILNSVSKILDRFHIIEQMKATNETVSEVATKKVETLHKIWIKLWGYDLKTIYQVFKNPNEILTII